MFAHISLFSEALFQYWFVAVAMCSYEGMYTITAGSTLVSTSLVTWARQSETGRLRRAEKLFITNCQWTQSSIYIAHTWYNELFIIILCSSVVWISFRLVNWEVFWLHYKFYVIHWSHNEGGVNWDKQEKWAWWVVSFWHRINGGWGNFYWLLYGGVHQRAVVSSTWQSAGDMQDVCQEFGGQGSLWTHHRHMPSPTQLLHHSGTPIHTQNRA